MILHQRPLRTTDDILSLTNSTLLSAGTILWCTKKKSPPVDEFRFLPTQKKNNSLLLQCPTFVSPNPLYTHSFPGYCCKWTWHLQDPYIPCTESPVSFLMLKSYQRISSGPRHINPFRNKTRFCDEEWLANPFRNKASFGGEEWLETRPTPQAGGPPLFCFPRLLIQYIRSYPPYWRPFLHPQPEDAPRRGDRNPLDGNANIQLK